MKRIKLIIGLATTLCCLASTSQAALMFPGGFTSPGTVGLDGGAVVIAPALPSGFVGVPGANFSGVLTSTVLLEGLGFNPLGGYTFVYHLANAGGSTHALGTLTINNWAGAAPGPVLPENTGAGTAATSADWNGDVIGFDWQGAGILPGSFGEVVIRTSLKSWSFTTASVIDGDTASGIATYAVPEPTTVLAGALLLLPFGASTIRFLRKSRTA